MQWVWGVIILITAVIIAILLGQLGDKKINRGNKEKKKS